MELSKEEKKAIIEQSIKNLDVSIYDATISNRVATMTGDVEAGKRVKERLEKLLKTKDAYTNILKEESDK